MKRMSSSFHLSSLAFLLMLVLCEKCALSCLCSGRQRPREVAEAAWSALREAKQLLAPGETLKRITVSFQGTSYVVTGKDSRNRGLYVCEVSFQSVLHGRSVRALIVGLCSALASVPSLKQREASECLGFEAERAVRR